MNKRVDKLQSIRESKNIDCILVFKPENRLYFSNFSGSTGYVILTKNKNIFATDFRYIEQAKEECKDFEIVELNKDYTIYNLLNKLDISTLGVEDDYVTMQFINSLQNDLVKFELLGVSEIIGNLRKIKYNEEIELISKAAQITDDAFSHILNIIKPGMTEREVALELEYFMKKNGASGPSFNIIVASGKRSSLPHGVASDKVIEIGDLVTIDMGCIYKGYCSDMTRTLVIGKANSKQKEIYNTVLNAQNEALNSIKPGMLCFELDKIARDIIADNGYGRYFGHGLGHGVGLEVHENPRLSPLDISKVLLEEGMIITDEPGIYIPDFGGVRIEDLVLVTKEGFEVLSKSTKELIELNY